MSSYFDAYFGAYAVPQLMDHMGTPGSVTITSGGTVVLNAADAILRHVSAVDEFTEEGIEVKKLSMEIEFVTDAASSYGGLDEDYTDAVVTVNGTNWAIERVVNWTTNLQKIEVTRVVPRNMTRQGYYGE